MLSSHPYQILDLRPGSCACTQGGSDLSIQQSSAVSVGHVASAIPAATALYAKDVFSAAALPELVRAAACALAGARTSSVRQAVSGALVRLLRGTHGEELLCRCARQHLPRRTMRRARVRVGVRVRVRLWRLGLVCAT